VEAIPGLVVVGATADGNQFIIRGTPAIIKAQLLDKPITILRGVPPAPPAPKPDPKAIDERISKLTAQLGTLTKAIEAKKDPVASSEGAGLAPMEAKTETKATPPAKTSPPEVAPAAVEITDVTEQEWVVRPVDGNLRLLAEKWAGRVTWRALWEVDRDLPIGGVDHWKSDFKTAIRRLLATSQFGDVHVKPCFHSNKVVRIVRNTAKCKPTE
jgi:hypothetical protein